MVYPTGDIGKRMKVFWFFSSEKNLLAFFHDGSTSPRQGPKPMLAWWGRRRTRVPTAQPIATASHVGFFYIFVFSQRYAIG